MNQAVHITLTADEALVLCEFLYRVDDNNCLAAVFHDQAEERVLGILEGQLEKQIPVFDPDYRALVTAARDRVRDPVV